MFASAATRFNPIRMSISNTRPLRLRRVSWFWKQPPTGRTFGIGLASLAVYVVVQNVDATLIASATGYTGNVGQLFTLSMTLACFDILFPLFYATTLAIGLRLVTSRLRIPRPALAMIAAVPFVAAAANRVAGVLIIGIVASYPSVPTFWRSQISIRGVARKVGIAPCL
jgi:hypothetical protein